MNANQRKKEIERERQVLPVHIPLRRRRASCAGRTQRQSGLARGPPGSQRRKGGAVALSYRTDGLCVQLEEDRIMMDRINRECAPALCHRCLCLVGPGRAIVHGLA